MNSGHMTSHVVLCLPDSTFSTRRCSLLGREGICSIPWLSQRGPDSPFNLSKILSVQLEATVVAVRFQIDQSPGNRDFQAYQRGKPTLKTAGTLGTRPGRGVTFWLLY